MVWYTSVDTMEAEYFILGHSLEEISEVDDISLNTCYIKCSNMLDVTSSVTDVNIKHKLSHL